MNKVPDPVGYVRPPDFLSLRRDLHMFEAGGPVILMYHKVDVPPPKSNLPALYVGKNRFRRQMDELIASGLPCLSLDETLAAARAGGKGYCLSFDDGFRNVYDHVLPVLQSRQLKAIQFIVAGLIGLDDAWDRVIGEPVQPLMDDAQIREWLVAGHEIGSHTLTHARLASLPPEQARKEIFDSKKRLEDRFGCPIRHFCYPYGDYNAQVRDFVAEAGYASACTIEFGVNDAAVGPYDLRRVMAGDNPLSLSRLARHAVRALRKGYGGL
jgi:peptidoglycan/xylan/chitin deacetylase (PgdA/CDA1 family)